MTAIALTGATHGIGRALARSLAAEGTALHLSGRDPDALRGLAAACADVGAVVSSSVADLSTREGARALGRQILDRLDSEITLISGAGVWPSRRELTDQGLERAFVVNALAPVILVRALADAGALARVVALGAGLMVKGRFDPERTPVGDDFSSVRTYCSTKLALAVALRSEAGTRPEVPIDVVHPGVVRTGLGDRRGPIGVVLRTAKRSWESPEVTADRLAKHLQHPPGPPGHARWVFEDRVDPWPEICSDPGVRAGVTSAVAAALPG